MDLCIHMYTYIYIYIYIYVYVHIQRKVEKEREREREKRNCDSGLLLFPDPHCMFSDQHVTTLSKRNTVQNAAISSCKKLPKAAAMQEASVCTVRPYNLTERRPLSLTCLLFCGARVLGG